jgi:hypothetical protein
MIVVAEGVSASGKSTWCTRNYAGPVVPEAERLKQPPQVVATPAAASSFWADRNALRWASALAMEKASGVAICDTDPLKLHYSWGLWQIGEASEDRWRHERAATRQAILDRRLGFADSYIIGVVDPDIARRRRDGDATRRRTNFELHLRLQPSLITWYGVLASVLPCLFTFSFPDRVPVVQTSDHKMRYDVELFDRAMALLPLPRPLPTKLDPKKSAP